jgi:anti-anti-sigma factor
MRTSCTDQLREQKERTVEIYEQKQDDILVLRVDNPIDSSTSPELGAKLEKLIDAGSAHLILDLDGVPYISSAGLRVLSLALRAVRNRASDGDLYLAGLSKTVAYAFRISGFDQVFCVYDTVEEAKAAMAASRALHRDTDLSS